ncbi:MAG: cyclase family protein [bacterium]|nr:cyclase family protein [bacterium]
MPRWIDLTAPLGHPDLALVPTFPAVEFWRFHELDTHGRQNSAVRMAIHQGTHIDAPRHFYAEGAAIDEMPLETFCGRAVKILLRDSVRPGNPITREMIERAPGFKPDRIAGAIAVTWSGWTKEAFFSDRYFAENPFLDKEACSYLCDLGMKALCMDHPIDPGMRPETVPTHEDSPGHRTVLGRGIPLIEHVVNLDAFDETEFEIFAFPMKLHEIEGAPARVVARLP